LAANNGYDDKQQATILIRKIMLRRQVCPVLHFLSVSAGAELVQIGLQILPASHPSNNMKGRKQFVAMQMAEIVHT
jgi:hypothetical protein